MKTLDIVQPMAKKAGPPLLPQFQNQRFVNKRDSKFVAKINHMLDKSDDQMIKETKWP